MPTGDRFIRNRNRDVLVLSLGAARPAGSSECDDGLVRRVDLETREVIGVEV